MQLPAGAKAAPRGCWLAGWPAQAAAGLGSCRVVWTPQAGRRQEYTPTLAPVTHEWYSVSGRAHTCARTHPPFHPCCPPPELADMYQLPYTRTVLAESLRLYPQPPILIRRCEGRGGGALVAGCTAGAAGAGPCMPARLPACNAWRCITQGVGGTTASQGGARYNRNRGGGASRQQSPAGSRGVPHTARLQCVPLPPCPRRALGDDVLPGGLRGDPGGYPIGKGADIFISIWNLHRWVPRPKMATKGRQVPGAAVNASPHPSTRTCPPHPCLRASAPAPAPQIALPVEGPRRIPPRALQRAL